MPDNNLNLKINSGANGSVYFAPDVISTIAGIALAEVDGIANTVHFSGLLTEKLTKRANNSIKSLTKGIKAEVNEGVVSVSITCVVEYGYSVPEVSKNIQENVKKTIENMTNMKVANVDVHVTGLSSEKENKEAAELEYRKYMLESQQSQEAIESGDN